MQRIGVDRMNQIPRKILYLQFREEWINSDNFVSENKRLVHSLTHCDLNTGQTCSNFGKYRLEEIDYLFDKMKESVISELCEEGSLDLRLEQMGKDWRG